MGRIVVPEAPSFRNGQESSVGIFPAHDQMLGLGHWFKLADWASLQKVCKYALSTFDD